MKQQSTHWSVVFDIVDAGLARDSEKVRNYAELLANRLEEVGDAAIANRLRRRVQRAPLPPSPSRSPFGGGSGSSALTPQAVFAPVDPESRSPFADEVPVHDEEPLILPPQAKIEIDRLINLRKRADEFLRAELPVPRSLLLYGPPGCGKSSTARYLARQLGLPLLMLRLDAVMSSYLGSTAKNVRTVFEHAARRGGILFLDEFDAVAKMRDDSNEVGEIKRIVNSVIQNLDAFPQLFVIAATNHEHLLDPAIWRRFDATIRLPIPGSVERRQLLQAYLPTAQMDQTALDSLVAVSEGLSGADIARVVIRARQEDLLRGDAPLLQLVIVEMWRQVEGTVESLSHADVESKMPILHFLDARTEGQLSSRTLAALMGISHNTVARLRRTEGEIAHHA